MPIRQYINTVLFGECRWRCGVFFDVIPSTQADLIRFREIRSFRKSMKKNQFFAIALLLCVLVLSSCSSKSATYSSTSWPGIAADGDVVYTANGTSVEAVQDGQKLWSYPESGNSRVSYYAVPAVDDDHVYVGTYNNRLQIFNKGDGSLVTDIEIGNNKNKVIASPLLADGNVIVLSSGGMVSSYPADVSGETVTARWQTVLSGEVWVKPGYDNGTLYVASMDKKMNLLDAETGELKNSIDLSGAIMNDPVLADGKLYFSTLAKEVDEMDLTSGEIRTLLTADGEIWASLLLIDGKLIAADMSGIIYCVDTETSEMLWKTDKLTADNSGFIASPVALDNETVLLITENGEIMTYDLEGKSVGQRTLGQTVYSTPAVMESGSFAILPMADNAQIKAFTADLKEAWVYNHSDKDKSESKAESTAESTAQAEEGK